jgi:hypothetical protein
VPPVTAFLFESDLDFEKGCYVSYVKKRAIGSFASTLGRCFVKYLREKETVIGTEELCTSAAKVSDEELAAKPASSARASRASSSESVAEDHEVSLSVHNVSPTMEVQEHASETTPESTVAVTKSEEISLVSSAAPVSAPVSRAGDGVGGA